MNKEEKIDRIKKIANRINSFCLDNGFMLYEEITQFGIHDFKLFSFDRYDYDKNKPTNGNLLEINIGWYFTPELIDDENIEHIDPDKWFLEINIHSDKFQNDFEQIYEGLDYRKEIKETRETWNFYPTKGDEENLNEVLIEVVKRIDKFNKD